MPWSRFGSRQRLVALILVVGLLLLCLTGSPKSSPMSFDSIALDFYLDQLHGPSVAPTDTIYSLDHGFSYELSGEPVWMKQLGERLCIIDLHNGTFSEPGEALGPSVMSWKANVDGLSLAMLNHWTYAKIHGYRYYHVHVEELHDRRMSWKKPKVMASILQHHDICVYMDTDATFTRLDLPLEWLLNYWRIEPERHAMALATDPQAKGNLDDYGNVYHNTGFMALVNSPRTFEILSQWGKCPDEGHPYPDCTRFRHRKYYRLDKERKHLTITGTDQAGFGNYVRHDYPEAIATLNCSEANGYPLSRTECEGTFVRHFWHGKQTHIKVEVAGQAPGRYLELLSAQYRREKARFWIKEASLGGQAP